MRVDTISSCVIPASRRDGLVVTQSASDLLVYDTERGELHHLNQTLAAVWTLCDGQQRLSDLARDTSQSLATAIDEGAIRLALTQLADAHLLAGPLPDEVRVARMSRRSLAKKAAIAGAVVAPALISTTVPTAAQSASTPALCGTPCTGFLPALDIFCADPFAESCSLCVPTSLSFDVDDLPDDFFGWEAEDQLEWILNQIPWWYSGQCVDPWALIGVTGRASRQAQPQPEAIVANELLAIILASAPQSASEEEQRSMLQSTSDEGDDEDNGPVSSGDAPTPTPSPEPTAIPEPTTAPTEQPVTSGVEPDEGEAPDDGEDEGDDQDESGT